MICRVLEEIRVKSDQGETVIPPGQIIRISPVKVKSLLATGKVRPVEEPKPLREARRQSLLDCMTATWETVAGPFHKMGFKPLQRTQEAESLIETIQGCVLEGNATLSDFREAVTAWKEAVESEGIN